MAASDSPLAAPAVVRALERSADATIARTLLARAIEAHPPLADELVRDELVRDGLVALACVSRSLSSAVVAEPEMLTPLRDRDDFFHERGLEGYRHTWRGVSAGGDRALRRWRRRELLRIATRDLLGAADLPAVGRELSALADSSLEAALDLVAPEIPFAVIGMGKLGGQELNYASDIDVLFVHEGDHGRGEHIARMVLATMTTRTEDGIVFRTDANLRPEGRSGPLTRTLDSYSSYYEGWGQTWEFQALLKARPVAGNRRLGDEFMALTRPFVWPEVLHPDAVREIRTMKARSEQETRRRGLDDRELKRGRGGIRDIEFAVQLLQVVHGRHDDSVRSPTTLDALHALAERGYVARGEATELDAAYRFLRTVEHRIQLYDEQQTHTVPADEAARTRLARVLGYRDDPGGTALEAFESDHRAHQRTVRSIHERLFFAPVLDTLAGVGSLPLEAAEERLTAFGFTDIARTRAAVRELADGLTRRSIVFHQLLPVILEWLSETPDPDLGLLQLRRLAEGPARSALVATTFRDSPGAAARACRLLGSSRVLGEALRRHPDFLEALGDDEALTRACSRATMVEDGLQTLEWREDDQRRREGLRRFKRRELLRIGARDLLGFATLETSAGELTALAEACLESALASLAAPLPFSVIGMGRLGGGELSYASDIDVVFVYDGETAADFAVAEDLATRLVAEIGATTAEGQTFRIDARLRPEGNQGPLARSLAGYAEYYRRWGLTWERQALSKARVVAGDAELGARFCDLVNDVVYGQPFTDEDAREVRRIKARIERERVPPGEDPQFHLKLGRGSLSDIEFTVQLLQLQHGADRPDLRVPGTIAALEQLRDADLLDLDDFQTLTEAYRFCERARNARYLQSAKPSDSLPGNSHELGRLALLLGYVHQPATALRGDYRRVTRRARKVVERVFYDLRDSSEG